MRLIAIVYVVIGVVVAAARDYFDRVGSVRGIVSLLIAIVLWPVVLFDIDVRIDRKDQGDSSGFLLPFGLMWAIATARGARVLEVVSRRQSQLRAFSPLRERTSTPDGQAAPSSGNRATRACGGRRRRRSCRGTRRPTSRILSA